MQESWQKNGREEYGGVEEERDASHADPMDQLGAGRPKDHAHFCHRLLRFEGPGSVTIPTFSMPAFLMASITIITRP